MTKTVGQRLGLFVLEYFRFWARLQLWKIKPIVVGITGSAGKTSTMDAAEIVLKEKYTVKSSYKANSQSGLSLNALDLAPQSYSKLDWLRLIVQAPWQVLTRWKKYQVYVAEMGIDGPDEPANMDYLLKIVTPHVGVFTSVTLVHAQAFDHLAQEKDVRKKEAALKAAIAAEKAKIITRLKATDFAIFNGDDPIIIAAIQPTDAKLLPFGHSNKMAVQLTGVDWKANETTFTLRHEATTVKVTIQQAYLPAHYGESFAAAAAVGVAMGVGLKTAAAALSRHFVLPPGRASLIAGINQSIILDSSYNSAPKPLQDFFELLKTLRQRKLIKGRLIGLLGDMRELGKISGYEHTQIAKSATEVFDLVYLVGPELREHAVPVLKKSKIPFHWFDSPRAAAEALCQELTANDLLFVKGSQNTILLEIVVEALMADPTKAEFLLCRRGNYWDRQRKKIA